MPATKCPLCESPCIIKIVSSGDDRYCEVDVCKMCGSMYPRGRTVVRVPVKGAKSAGRLAKGKAPRKK